MKLTKISLERASSSIFANPYYRAVNWRLLANGANLQLLSDGEIPIKEVNVAALLKGHKFTVSQVCHHFDNKQY